MLSKLCYLAAVICVGIVLFGAAATTSPKWLPAAVGLVALGLLLEGVGPVLGAWRSSPPPA